MGSHTAKLLITRPLLLKGKYAGLQSSCFQERAVRIHVGPRQTRPLILLAKDYAFDWKSVLSSNSQAVDQNAMQPADSCSRVKTAVACFMPEDMFENERVGQLQ